MLIGLCGWQGVGKSTVAKQIRTILSQDNNTIILPMAENLRHRLKAKLNSKLKNNNKPPLLAQLIDNCIRKGYLDPWAKPTPVEMRELLIYYGNLNRQYFKDFWVMEWASSYNELNRTLHNPNIIVDDIRYQNEAEKIIELGGKLVYLYRDGIKQNPDLDSEDLDWLKNVKHELVELLNDIDKNNIVTAYSILKLCQQ